MSKRYRHAKLTWPVLLLLVIAATVTWFWGQDLFVRPGDTPYSISLDEVPAFSGAAYVVINDNRPQFTDQDMTTESYEYYSPLDALGRCGYTMACVGRDLMPTEDRGSISQVKPTGWVQAQYDFVDGKNLYNRCHLIGFQLTGENANERNLITGTRYCNVEGMLPFENMVADYVQETGNHVLYRVTPIFRGNELVARGIQLEAYSVEDNGDGVYFHVYVYNNQPGVTIDYTTGESWLDGQKQPTQIQQTEAKTTYVLNTSSKKFHTENCSQGQSIKQSNKKIFTGDREDLIEKGYTASKCCNP